MASPVDVNVFLKHEYDYIICGGGTAGLTLAVRLTENPNITVGVIEAGKNKLDDMFVDTPALCTSLSGNPEYDWIYKTEGNHGQIHHIPRGKVLGGSSGTNYLMYVRGYSQDYDDWAEITGDSSWSASEMMRYMKKHQTLEPVHEDIKDRSNLPFIASNHGFGGPIHTSFNESIFPIEEALIKAGEQVTGLSKKPVDPWGGEKLGFYLGQGTIARTGPNKGKQSYAARDYYLPVSTRPNLQVITESTVAKVVLENKTAIGVEFISKGQHHHVRAKREVIVSGGVIGSPQILELSGIGDPDILTKAGVECLVDLPSVGTDLQDHAMSWIVQQLAPGMMSGDSFHKPEVGAAAQKEFAENQAGPLTSVASSSGYFPATMFLEDGELDEIEKHLSGPYESDFQKHQLQQMLAQIKSDKSASLYYSMFPVTPDLSDISDHSTVFPARPPGWIDGITMLCSLQYCASRGYVHITSNDPTVHPELNPRYMSNEADVILRGACLNFLDKITNSEHVKNLLGKRLVPEEDEDISTKEKRREQARRHFLSQFHPVGSCAMGHTVDSRLKVNGVQNLRVVDASIFPGHVSGNTVATVYAIAEKAADMIKADWK